MRQAARIVLWESSRFSLEGSWSWPEIGLDSCLYMKAVILTISQFVVWNNSWIPVSMVSVWVSAPGLLHAFVSNSISHTWRKSALVVVCHTKILMKNNTASFKEADAAPFVLYQPSSPLMPTAVPLLCTTQPSKGRKQIIENVDLINYHSQPFILNKCLILIVPNSHAYKA